MMDSKEHVTEHERAFVEVLQRAGFQDADSYVEPARWLQLIDNMRSEQKHQSVCKPRPTSDMIDSLVCSCDCFIDYMNGLIARGETPRLPCADKDGVDDSEALAFDVAHLGFTVEELRDMFDPGKHWRRNHWILSDMHANEDERVKIAPRMTIAMVDAIASAGNEWLQRQTHAS